jgi:hypothetical protein
MAGATPLCIQVTDFLFIGDLAAAKDLNLLHECGITHVLIVAALVKRFHEGSL